MRANMDMVKVETEAGNVYVNLNQMLYVRQYRYDNGYPHQLVMANGDELFIDDESFAYLIRGHKYVG
jgi:hypothetical protein